MVSVSAGPAIWSFGVDCSPRLAGSLSCRRCSSSANGPRRPTTSIPLLLVTSPRSSRSHDLAIEENRQPALEALSVAAICRCRAASPLSARRIRMVIEAALRRGRPGASPVLIEATCNQVNQEGGYTGMTPADFRRFVEDDRRSRSAFPPNRLILGGDHLGPNPWKKLAGGGGDAARRSYGDGLCRGRFRKIHLDTSMGCAGEPAALADEVDGATRGPPCKGRRDEAAGSAARAPSMSSAPRCRLPAAQPTPSTKSRSRGPEAVEKRWRCIARHLRRRASEMRFERVIGIVVQPGVEFGNANVALYNPSAPGPSRLLDGMPGWFSRRTRPTTSRRAPFPPWSTTALPFSRSARV